jgi:hypothetical protein
MLIPLYASRLSLYFSVYLLALLCSCTAVAAPAPVFKEPPPPHFAGWYTCNWRIPSQVYAYPCWFGEFRKDGSIHTPGVDAVYHGPAKWQFDPKSRILTIDWPKVDDRIWVQIDTGKGHQFDTKENKLLWPIDQFVMKRYIPAK